MSLKRKADQLSLPSTGNISAFAASRATRDPVVVTRSSEDDSDGDVDLDKDAATDEEDPLFLRSETLPREYEDASDHEVDFSADAKQLAGFAAMQLSTWYPQNDNILPGTEKAACIRLKPAETVTFIGQYDLWVKVGIVKLYGATLRKSNVTYRVFAPSTHALPSITCHSNTPAEIEVWSCRYSMRPLGKVSPLYRRIWNQTTKAVATDSPEAAVQKRSFSYLRLASDDALKRMLFPLGVPLEWSRMIQTVSRALTNAAPRIFVCGPKASGKSTFARLLTNHLVTSKDDVELGVAETVCWLDLDPGQPEFSPPGQVSLVHVRKPNFGPPFSHAYTHHLTSFRTLKAHAIGAITPKDDPNHFLNCAADLLSVQEKLLLSFPKCPLIINCPGWILGSALGIMTLLVKMCAPTDVVLMDGSTLSGHRLHNEIFTALTHATGCTPLHVLPQPSRPPTYTARTAAEFRTMQDISYFHQLEPAYNQLRWTAAVRDKQNPWTLSFSDADKDFLGIWSIGEQPNPDFLSCVLQGSMVAICVLEGDSDVSKAMGEISRTAVEKLPYWPGNQSGYSPELEPSRTRMLGLALVQEVDTHTQCLKLQTPLSTALRHEAMVRSSDESPKLFLVRGSLDTPGWAYLESHHVSRRRATGQTDANGAVVVADEDLTVKHVLHPDGNEDPADASDEDLVKAAWVKRMKPGEVIGQRWRVRKDIGRPAQSLQGFNLPPRPSNLPSRAMISHTAQKSANRPPKMQ